MIMKRVITTSVAVAILAAVPGVAVAQEAPERYATQHQDAGRVEREADWIEQVKTRALEAIEKRLETIGELEAAINRSETVGPDHAATLLSELRASAAGLEALAGEIRSATDLEELRVLVPKIFEDYRIYAIVAPKVHLVLAADKATAVTGRMAQATESLGDILDRLEESGIDVTEATELLEEMMRLVASGAEQAGTVPGLVLGLTPADYPASTETIRAAHETLKSAGQDLRAAGQTAHEIVRFIKSVTGDLDG